MTGDREEVDVSSLFAKPKWWVPTAILWISIVVLVFGALWSFGEAIGAYKSKLAADELDGERGPLAAVLAGVFQFVWYLLSTSFWAILLLAAGRGFEKLDQLVWLNASAADRTEIIRRRTSKRSEKPKKAGGWHD